ncbi:DUF4179 domain-containing protein [Pontibacillus yanchengensis]|uniref:DUF4179 domain-containing protein n=1 Tax=Pontibacillus yanchengensis TaxID=462910 RepID=A0ACC7VEI6_9BACI|nr:DUF4179 domain-containing protein [Pontibacillus yanchengensis]MYL53187.1 DUF4179 domain-containing protein [Pontibacillus yanchengensis]
MNKRFKTELDQYIGESPLLKEEDRANFFASVHDGGKHKKRKLEKRLTSILASLMILFSAGVVTAYNPFVNNLVSLVSPEIALLLKPIEKTSVDNDIKMETVAAISDDEMAVIYITLQDLSGDRIDSTLDLYDFSLSGAQMFNSKVIAFDETTKTATLRIQANGGEDLNGEKVKFQIQSFLSHKETHEFEKRNISSILKEEANTMTLDMNNIPGGGGELYRSLENQETIQVLQPAPSKNNIFKHDFMEVTNVGLIEDRLHVQVRWDEDYVDSHGQLTLTDQTGSSIKPSSVQFGFDGSKTSYGREYTEYIFKVESEDHLNYDLSGNFVASGLFEEGSWNTTFKLQAEDSSLLEMKFEMSMGGWTSNQLTIHPLGVTLQGEGSLSEGNKPNVDVKLTNDEIVTLPASKAINENGEVIMKFESDIPLDPMEIKSVIINGTEKVIK